MNAIYGGYDVDVGRQQYEPRGWVDTQEHKEIKKISVQINSENEMNPDEIKHSFAMKIAKEIMDSGLLEIDFHKWAPTEAPFGGYVYRADLAFAPCGISHVSVNNKIFHAHNQKWTQDEIEEALKYTYPEKLL